MQKKNKSNYRWRILALIFVATTINYLDRAKIGALAPTLQYKIFDWDDVQFSYVQMAFKFAYMIGMLCMGALVDKMGTKKGFTLSIGIWSLFGVLHAAVTKSMGWIGFALARFGLGIGQAGNFPAANKAVAEWFPKKERALAVGLFNSGTNLGAILAPLLIALVVLDDGTGWQFVFWSTGILSVLWILLWYKMYIAPEKHPRLSKEELDYINSDVEADDKQAESEEKISWKKLIFVKQTWAFSAAKITDAVWWFYLFWGGKFLFDYFGLNIRELAMPLIVIYVISIFGSITGGWMSSFFIKRGWSINKSRKIVLLICAIFTAPVVFSTQIDTQFTVNEQSIAKLEMAKVRVLKGKPKVNLPADVMNSVKRLSGKTYTTAKDFKTDLMKFIDKNNFHKFEATIYQNTRSNNLYWIAVLLIAFAAAGHQAWNANMFSVVSDVFPKRAVASVTGIGGMVGATSGLIADATLGQVLQGSGMQGYFYAFLFAGMAYLAVLGIVHLIMPTISPLDKNLKLIQSK